MTSHETIRELRTLLDLDAKSGYFLKVLTRIQLLSDKEVDEIFFETEGRRAHRTLREFLIFVTGQVNPSFGAKKFNYDYAVGELEKFLEEIDLKEYFLALDRWETYLSKSRLEFGRTPASTIHEDFTGFSHAFAAALSKARSRRADDLIEILKTAEKLSRDLRGLSTLAHFLEDNLTEKDITIAEGSAPLMLLLHADSNYGSVAEKIQALDLIYLELCELFNVSSKDKPLTIGKIESGSLWLKVFGESRVIASMISLIESSVAFLYRNFTNEGKTQALPKNFEVISSILDLEKKLRDAGIDTKEMDEHIKKSSVLVAKQLTRLLSGEPVVEINGRLFSVGDELEKFYLSQSRTPLLESINQDMNPD